MRLFGGLLLAIGVLIMTLSGGCSVVYAIGTLSEGMSNIGMLAPILFVGGIPFAIGFGLFAWGRSIIKRGDADKLN